MAKKIKVKPASKNIAVPQKSAPSKKVAALTRATSIEILSNQENTTLTEKALITANINIEVSGAVNAGVQDFIGNRKITKTYTIGATRAGGVTEIVDGDELVKLEFTDGTQWIGYAADTPEIYGSNVTYKRGVQKDVWALPQSLDSNAENRGVLTSVLKFLHVIEPKAAEEVGEALGKKADGKLMTEPGLFRIDKDFNKQKIDSAEQFSGIGLLLLHGTASSVDGSFASFKKDIWKEIHAKYDYVIAFNHYTISVSPFKNAADVLNLLPNNANIDLLSHSRGGLIADILCRLDRRNMLLFGEAEQELFIDDETVIQKELETLNKIAERKQIYIDHQVRVACPAGGTSLLSERLDHFLNAIINTIKFSIGIEFGPWISLLQDFLLDVVKSRTKADVMPGLWAMCPDSNFQKLLNKRSFGTHEMPPQKTAESILQVPAKLFVIAGNSEIGGSIKQTFTVILSNLFYRQANDWIVDTKSMKRGIARANGVYQFLSEDSKTCHFNYFKNENTSLAIQYALLDQVSEQGSQFTHLTTDEMDRSWLGKKIFAHISTNKASGKRPIFILIPGIMGSSLKNNGSRVWANLMQLGGGAFISKLAYNISGISAEGAISTFYEDFVDEYSKYGDVEIFAYDWRKPLSIAADELSKRLSELDNLQQPMHIVAHSMGGLVIKQLIAKHHTIFDNFMQQSSNKLFFCGTPWQGSHMVLRVFAAQYGTLNTIAKLDLFNNKKNLLQTIREFAGLVQLLPVTKNEDFTTTTLWAAIQKHVPSYVVPSANALKEFAKYKQDTAAVIIPTKYLAKTFYIAGCSSATTCDYSLRSTNMAGNYIEFLSNNRGDGSTLWDLSIPKEMPANHIYYCKSNHENILNDKKVIEAIIQIVRTGSSSILTNTQPISAAKEALAIQRSVPKYPATEKDYYDALLINSDDNLDEEENIQDSPTITCRVLNADLRESSFPVMVGHFLNDGLFSAESALNNLLNYKLSERHFCGFYPGNIGDSEIIIVNDSKVKGGIIAGLGKLDDITSYRLTQTIEKAALKYSFYCRDNNVGEASSSGNLAISSIIIASNFAGLSVEESMKAILQGINKANHGIAQLTKSNKTKTNLKIIDQIEFVDYYEDIAQKAHKVLHKLKDDSMRITISVKKFKIGAGSKRRIMSDDGPGWWHVFSTADSNPKFTKGVRPNSLTFTSTAGRARVEQGDISGNLQLVEYLAKEFSNQENWNPEISRTMLELLIPNEFKTVVRSQNNIQWKLDDYSAQFPWELLHDSNYGTEPTFVNTGLIRQLFTDNYRINPEIIENRQALVIGNPDYSGTTIPQLPGAEEEANEVIDILNANGYSVKEMVRKSAAEIITGLYSSNFKIMHIAAHGMFETSVDAFNETKITAGIVLGQDVLIDPATINQLSSVPEFIFVNCCHLGNSSLPDDKLIKNRSKLASNIGTQLIRMGVKAVVVAGWAVNDTAAKTFAGVLYRNLFGGYAFGTAVKNARRATYDKHKHTNTWGAYQCYGDYNYRLTNKAQKTKTINSFVTESSAIVSVENLYSDFKNSNDSKEKNVDKLIEIIEQIKEEQLYSPFVQEMHSRCLAELGFYKEAMHLLAELTTKEFADFSVASYELLFSLKAKVILQMFEESHKLGDVKTLLAEAIADGETLIAVGATTKRYCHCASLYKRLAVIDNTKKKQYLQKAKDYYKAALKIGDPTKGMLENKLYNLYAFVNLYLMCKASEDWKNETVYFTPSTAHAILTEKLAVASSLNTDNFELYDYDNLAKLQFCLFVAEDTDKQKSKQYFHQYVAAVEMAFNKKGNAKYMQGELEQLGIIERLIKFNKFQQNQIEEYIKIKK
jgi:CHAT domain/Lecithin:cholesterol acyltransferase